MAKPRSEARKASRIRTANIIRRARNGDYLRHIAKDYGVSERWVTMVVSRVPGLREEARAARKAMIPSHRLWRKFAERAKDATPCIVCGYWVLRKRGSKCCSPECTDIQQIIWKTLEPERIAPVQRRIAERHLERLALGKEKEGWWTGLHRATVEGKPPKDWYKPRRGSKHRHIIRYLGLLTDEKPSKPLLP